jgi:predicted murein hydrolase (TIGR00659 family)
VDTLITQASELWYSLQHKPLFGLLLSLSIYQFAVMLYEYFNKRVFLHPVATGSIAIAIILNTLNISYKDYLQANQLLYFLLGPATVALAIPLFQEFHHIRKLTLPTLTVVVVGGSFAAASAVVIAMLMGAPDNIQLALMPKSVTTPIALGIAEIIGALPGLTTGVVVFTGVIGALLSPVVFSILRLHDPRLQGLVLGLNAHGVGTARAFEMNPTTGAFASLAMGLTGAFTALTVPYAVKLLN